MKDITPFLVTALVAVVVLFVVFRLAPAAVRKLIVGA
jgi:hypothetical protein